MKRHVMIPVMFRREVRETEHFGMEFIVESFNNSKNKDILKGNAGSVALEVLLDAGWSIISVQSATYPGGSSSGATVFVYILESPEINEAIT